jgi:gas vesicle protein
MAKRHGNLALSGLALAGLGYLLGILTAPKSGKETRKDIQKTALKAKTEAEKNLKSIHSELNHLLTQGQGVISDNKTKAKTGLNDAVEQARKAQSKVREILSAYHEGEPEDKDLRSAVADAQSAIKHLRKYLGKKLDAKKAR